MEKKIAGLLGAVATLGAFTAAEAAPIANPAPAEILNANSFADLLEPNGYGGAARGERER